MLHLACFERTCIWILGALAIPCRRGTGTDFGRSFWSKSNDQIKPGSKEAIARIDVTLCVFGLVSTVALGAGLGDSS